MAVSCYLAMTAAEIQLAPQLPEKLAYMACHFSPYGTGLSNIPASLPPDSILILNDRTPIGGHDPGLIAQQLSQITKELSCKGVLLDFQRPDIPETAELTSIIASELACPVGVSMPYADGLSCPVFLPPVPLNRTIATYLSPWAGREIWLEAALDAITIQVTKEGSSFTEIPYAPPPEGCHTDKALRCRYCIHAAPEQVLFTLYRSEEMLRELLSVAEEFGVCKAIGLYQQLGNVHI